MRRRPNLYIIGAMKSGTSSLHEYLAAHPQIFMSKPKEPAYFVDPEILRTAWAEMYERGYWRSESNYLALFDGAGDAPIVGESSTDYSKLPLFTGVVEKIARFSPDARFIYMMRDPVERTISHYWHMVEHRNERQGLLEALRSEPQYLDVSHYAMQLRPYLEAFGREQLYTLTLEEHTADALGTVQRIYAWLGVDPSFEPPNLAERRNVTPQAVFQTRGLGLLERFRHSAAWDQIGPAVPARLRRVGMRLAKRSVLRREVRRDQAAEYLRPIQRQQVQDLCELLGRQFPEWRTVNA